MYTNQETVLKITKICYYIFRIEGAKMVSRTDRYDYDNNETNSRVARNQELYKRIYEDDSYLKTEEKPSEYTQEINIEKVKELLKGRENYRKEMLMREYNIIKDKKEEEPIEETEEVKKYDINEYLNKAASEKEYQPYHKINLETLKKEEESTEETEETPASNLENMGNTELSLDMFEDLADKGKTVEITTTNIKLELTDEDEDEEENDEEEIEEETEDSEEDEDEEETEDDEFFTQSLKKQLNDSEEVEEGSSKLIKIIIVILVLIIIGLVAFLILM